MAASSKPPRTGPKRKTLREKQKLAQNQFTLPHELLEIAQRQGLVIALDKKPKVRDDYGTWIRPMRRDLYEAEPERYVLYTDGQTLRADLLLRNLYPGCDPKGYIKFREIPAGVTLDWETGVVTLESST